MSLMLVGGILEGCENKWYKVAFQNMLWMFAESKIKSDKNYFSNILLWCVHMFQEFEYAGGWKMDLAGTKWSIGRNFKIIKIMNKGKWCFKKKSSERCCD